MSHVPTSQLILFGVWILLTLAVLAMIVVMFFKARANAQAQKNLVVPEERH